MRTLRTLVIKDHAGLLAAPLQTPLTSAELEMFPALVELLGEQQAARDAAAAGTPLSAGDAGKLGALRDEQAKLDRAFRVRLRGDRAGLRQLAEIRRGAPDDLEDALDDARKLVALADHNDNESWIARLTKGGPAALEALRKATPALDAMVQRWTALGLDPAARGRVARISTLSLRIAGRVVAAGKYHTSDQPGRETDYQRFRAPPVRKPRKKPEPKPA